MRSHFAPPRAFVLVLLWALSQVACIQWFAGKAADGVARLTMRNVGAVMLLAQNDERCGFSSEAVLADPVIEGEVGAQGSVTWRVFGCTLNTTGGERRSVDLSTDCLGNTTAVIGTVTFTGEKTIHGHITGDAETPVIPDAPDAVEFRIIEAKFDRFKVNNSASDSSLRIDEGSLSAVVRPRLAVSSSTDACSVATPHLTFESVAYSNAKVHVSTADRSFDADVPESNLNAQNGKNGGTENVIGGTLNIWDKGAQQIPSDGEGLDPEYNAETFATGFACAEDLKLPVAHTCDIKQSLRHGAARLSVKTFGGMVLAANADTNCGFWSPESRTTFAALGTMGSPDGEVIYYTRECVLDFPEPTALSTDCQGVTTYVQGRAVVSGTKAIRGYLTEDPEEHIVPNEWEPAALSVRGTLENFTITADGSDRSLTVLSGALSGIFEPRMAIDKELDVCGIVSPVARFREIQWEAAELQLNNGPMSFNMSAHGGSLSAHNGPMGEFENHLEGSVLLDGETFEVPADDSSLNPDYDRDAFNAAYLCDDNMAVAQSDADCSLDETIAQGAARMLIKNFVYTAIALNYDTNCGFSGVDGMLPADLQDAGGDEVTATWRTQGCRIGGGEPLLVREDCFGNRVWLHGAATLDAARLATGRVTMGSPPIQPTRRDAAQFVIQEMVMDNIKAVEYAPGNDEPEPYLLLQEGTMSGIERPIMGESIDPVGSMHIGTPVLGYDKIRGRNLRGVLVAGTKRFNVSIDYTLLNGFNGIYRDEANFLRGEMNINGRQISIPVPGDDGSLNPYYDQATFDASYVCLDNLVSTIPLH